MFGKGVRSESQGGKSVTAKSWVPGADESGFSLANLPYGVAELRSGDFRVCVAIGRFAFDLARAANLGLFDGIGVLAEVWTQSALNSFLELSIEKRDAIRKRIRHLLSVAGEKERAA